MTWKIAAASARGSSHQRSGRPNQDAYEHGIGAKDGPVRAILAVSDGHGGGRHFRSEIGSRFAVHIAVSALPDLIASHLDSGTDPLLTGTIVPEMLQKLTQDWQAAVASDVEHNPFTPAELEALVIAEGSTARVSVEQEPAIAYGATLLLAVATDAFVFYAQLGDGDILSVSAAGETRRPLPADDRLIGNQTTSLCQPDAWREFRWTVEPEPAGVAAVFASTDGYANSFRSEQDFLQIGRDYVRILREDGLSGLSEDLPGILAEASEKGSGDDITLGILLSDAAYAAVVASGSESKQVATAAPVSVPEVEVTPSARSGTDREVPVAIEAASTSRGPELSAPPVGKTRTLSPSQLRVIAVVTVILAGTFGLQYYRRLPDVQASRDVRSPGTSKPEAPGTVEAAPAASLPLASPQWVLQIHPSPQSAARSVPLALGKMILLKDLPGAGTSAKGAITSIKGKIKATPSELAYAQVTRGEDGQLRLTNLSRDPWAVQLPDQAAVEPPVGHGDTVLLAEGVKITFRSGAEASIGSLPVVTPALEPALAPAASDKGSH